MSAASPHQLHPLLLHGLFDLKVLHPEQPNATSGSRAFGPNPLHLVRQFRGIRNLTAFVKIGAVIKTLGKLRNFLSWVIDGRHLAMNLMVGLETRRVALCRTCISSRFVTTLVVSGVCPPTGAALARARWN